jgi:hypothetical protein
MYQVEQSEPSYDFKKAWSAAGTHIQSQADKGLHWLRANLNLPMAEHLSFRIGNQIFFIFVEAAEFKYKDTHELFNRVCQAAGAIPCLMPMEEVLNEWRPKHSGWGLVDVRSMSSINPLDFVTDELIELTDWEIHDFAIQIVCSFLENQGKKIISRQPSMEIFPSLWFHDENGSNYVVVKAGRYPDSEIPMPSNIQKIKETYDGKSMNGFFASVIFVNSKDPFDPDAKKNGNFLPLYRGHAVMPKFSGLIAL